MFTKHGLNRMLERVVLKQNKRMNKRQRKKLESKARMKFNKDMEKKVATIKSKNGKIYVYANLKEDNSCTKYVLSSKYKLITVMEVNLDEEKKKVPLKVLERTYE